MANEGITVSGSILVRLVTMIYIVIDLSCRPLGR